MTELNLDAIKKAIPRNNKRREKFLREAKESDVELKVTAYYDDDLYFSEWEANVSPVRYGHVFVLDDVEEMWLTESAESFEDDIEKVKNPKQLIKLVKKLETEYKPFEMEGFMDYSIQEIESLTDDDYAIDDYAIEKLGYEDYTEEEILEKMKDAVLDDFSDLSHDVLTIGDYLDNQYSYGDDALWTVKGIELVEIRGYSQGDYALIIGKKGNLSSSDYYTSLFYDTPIYISLMAEYSVDDEVEIESHDIGSFYSNDDKFIRNQLPKEIESTIKSSNLDPVDKKILIGQVKQKLKRALDNIQ